jgi:hypothetical protein
VSLSATLAGAGCSDQVVGYFGEDGSSSDALSTGGTAAGGDSTGSTGAAEMPFSAPGCFSDDFEDGQVDDGIWNTWLEGDAQLAEAGGWIKFTPPTVGLLDTGLVTNYLHDLPFVDASVRLQVPMPPAASRPVALFLQVIEEPLIVSMAMSNNTLRVSGNDGDIVLFSQEYPTDPYPGWIGMRAEGDQVHFETSDDGVTWTVLDSRPKPGPMLESGPLVMAQTFGDDVAGGVVAIDNFEACAQ